MQIRTTLMFAALAIACAACNRADRDHRDPTVTVKPVEPAPVPAPGSGAGAKPIDPAAPGPVKLLEKEALAAKYKDCVTFINTAQLEAFERECVAEGFVGRHVDGMEVRGADGVVGMFGSMRTAFPDLELSPQLIAISGRNILAINLLTGTHEDDLEMPLAPAIPKTGKQVGMLFFHRLAIDDHNKAVEELVYSDPLAMMGQLGRLPKQAEKTRPRILQGLPNAPIIAITEDSETERTNLEIFNKAAAAFDKRDLVELARYWAVDGIESDHAMAADLMGRAAIIKMTKDLFTGFPDVKANFTHQFAAGDYVFGLGRITGANTGAIGGMKATDKQIDAHFVEIAKMKNGKIKQLWRFRNGLAIATQLGLVDASKLAPQAQPTAPQPAPTAPQTPAPAAPPTPKAPPAEPQQPSTTQPTPKPQDSPPTMPQPKDLPTPAPQPEPLPEPKPEAPLEPRQQPEQPQ